MFETRMTEPEAPEESICRLFAPSGRQPGRVAGKGSGDGDRLHLPGSARRARMRALDLGLSGSDGLQLAAAALGEQYLGVEGERKQMEEDGQGRLVPGADRLATSSNGADREPQPTIRLTAG
jgi:hypothetical protein